MEVAREKLPLEYTKEVAIACLQVLQSSQRQSYDSLSHSMEPDQMCAVINDNQRMQEKCDEFGEYLCRFVEEGPDKELLLAILEEVSSEYIALAVKAVNFLAKYTRTELLFYLQCCFTLHRLLQVHPGRPGGGGVWAAVHVRVGDRGR